MNKLNANSLLLASRQLELYLTRTSNTVIVVFKGFIDGTRFVNILKLSSVQELHQQTNIYFTGWTIKHINIGVKPGHLVLMDTLREY